LGIWGGKNHSGVQTVGEEKKKDAEPCQKEGMGCIKSLVAQKRPFWKFRGQRPGLDIKKNRIVGERGARTLTSLGKGG